MGTESLFQNFGDVALGTLFATTLVGGAHSPLPYIYKRAVGMPKIKSDDDKRNALVWQYLRGNGDDILNSAYSELERPDGWMGNRSILISDGYKDGNAPKFFVPESPTLQRYGYKAGDEVNNMADLRFIEMAQLYDEVQSMNDTMSLNDFDKQLMASQDGLVSKMMVGEMYSKYSAMREAKDALDNNKDDSKSAELQANYDTAVSEFEYYSKARQETGHTQAIDDLVKDNRTIKLQVDAEMSKYDEYKGKSFDELKGNEEYRTKYFDSMLKVFKKNFSYKQLEQLRLDIARSKEEYIAANQEAIDMINSGKWIPSLGRANVEEVFTELTQEGLQNGMQMYVDANSSELAEVGYGKIS